jgi:hypothetical protein
MAEVLITNPQININDELIPYVPDTLSLIKNTAKTNVKTLTVGGTSAYTVHSKDVSDSTSKVEFSVKVTKRIIELVDDWINNLGTNVIEVSSSDGVLALAFTGCSLLDSANLDFGANKDVKITFLGDPIQ